MGDGVDVARAIEANLFGGDRAGSSATHFHRFGEYAALHLTGVADGDRSTSPCDRPVDLQLAAARDAAFQVMSLAIKEAGFGRFAAGRPRLDQSALAARRGSEWAEGYSVC